MRSILITGGAGFIGCNFVHYWAKKHEQDRLVILDLLTYAGSKSSIESIVDEERIFFVKGDICDIELVTGLFRKYCIDIVVNFAAESHVDRSILSSAEFVRTNVHGTQVLLDVALNEWKSDFDKKRFHHVSTDEVYGHLNLNDPAFTESTPYAPRSIYAATKASSDMLVRAYYETHGLPISISNCSNNYGPYQHPEKLMPLVLTNILLNKKIPVYGNGKNIRDWLYVHDHCKAIESIIDSEYFGETFNVGGNNEIENIKLVELICTHVDKKIKQDPDLQTKYKISPASNDASSLDLITFVKDRPGHDFRYAIDTTKIETKLGFSPANQIEEGLESTIEWYLFNDAWWVNCLGDGDYHWLTK